MRRRPSLPVLLLTSVLAACSHDPAGPAEKTDFRPLFATFYSNLRSPARLIISDQQAWNEIWNVIGASNAAGSQPPRIDFIDSEVLIVALGEQKRAGYKVTIEQVVFTDSSRNVHYLATIPGEQCSAAEVITTPLDAVVASRSARPTLFIEKLQTGACN